MRVKAAGKTVILHLHSLTHRLRYSFIESVTLFVKAQTFYANLLFGLLSCVQPFATPRTEAHQAPLSFTIFLSFLKLIESFLKLIEFSQTPLSQWCHPIISSSVAPFSSCPQYVPALGSFPMAQLFESGGQSIEASAPVVPMNIQGWFPSGWLVEILAVWGILNSVLQHQCSKASILWCSAFFMIQF